MTNLVKYQLGDDEKQTILFEAVGDGRPRLVSSKKEIKTEKIDQSLSLISPVLDQIKKMVMNTDKPEEITVELNIGVATGIGFFVASGEANASIKITLKWA